LVVGLSFRRSQRVFEALFITSFYISHTQLAPSNFRIKFMMTRRLTNFQHYHSFFHQQPHVADQTLALISAPTVSHRTFVHEPSNTSVTSAQPRLATSHRKSGCNIREPSESSKVKNLGFNHYVGSCVNLLSKWQFKAPYSAHNVAVSSWNVPGQYILACSHVRSSVPSLVSLASHICSSHTTFASQDVRKRGRSCVHNIWPL
jgi:hypothetical protein